MADNAERLGEIKRKVRKLKQLEIKIRFSGINQSGRKLIWDKFFDLHEAGAAKAKNSLYMLASMNHEEYKKVIDEYFAFVY